MGRANSATILSCISAVRRVAVGARGLARMPRGVKKEHLPSKVCVTCDRPFTWRKKWERCWDEVTTCSKSRNAARKRTASQAKQAGKDSAQLSDSEEARSSGSSEEVSDRKAQVTDRKARKKAIKAEQRAKRSEGGQPKPCGKCGCDVELLIRCQIDADQEWWMVCGKCWPLVSGGVTDGDAAHPHYRYGGLWKI